MRKEPYYYIDPRWKKSSDENFDSLRIILSLYNSEAEDGVSESKKATKLLMSVNKHELICMKNYLKKGLGQTEEATIKKFEPYVAVLSFIGGTFYEVGLLNDVYTCFSNILPKKQIENITHLIVYVGLFFIILICAYIYEKDVYSSERRKILQWSLSEVENALEMKKSD